MKNSEQESTKVEIKAGKAIFTATGLVILSPGFLRVYKDEGEEKDILPDLKKGEALKLDKLETKDKKTMPPARYNEASLIEKLEKEGIGRPSTYAAIISTIQGQRLCEKTK